MIACPELGKQWGKFLKMSLYAQKPPAVCGIKAGAYCTANAEKCVGANTLSAMPNTLKAIAGTVY